MNKLIILMVLGAVFAGRSMAQDSFDREFSKFDKDFERLNTWKADTPASKKYKRPATAESAPAHPAADDKAAAPAQAGTVTPLNDEAAVPKAPADEATLSKPDKTSRLPKGAKVEKLAHSDLLGNQISDPEMRKKVQDLYRRKDVVVQQYVLPTN